MKKIILVVSLLAVMCVGVFAFTGDELFQKGKDAAINKGRWDAAFDYFKRGAEMNDAKCQYALAECYEFGKGCEQDIDNAIYWYKKSAEQDYFSAKQSLERLGIIKPVYENGWNKDYFVVAFELYKRGAENNDPQSQYFLADCYEFGKGCEQDIDNAIYWYKKSAEQDYFSAKQSLERLGIIKPVYKKASNKDYYVETFERYKRDAENNNPQSQYFLADCYEFGKGCEQDIDNAIYWYKKSAEQDYFSAKQSLERLGIAQVENKSNNLPLDKIAEIIVALGVPGLVIVIVGSTITWSGAAWLTTLLATLGGPAGMLGGVGVLGVVGLVSIYAAKYGYEAITTAVLKKMVENGKTKEEIIEEIDKMPMSREMKLKVKDKVMNTAY